MVVIRSLRCKPFPKLGSYKEKKYNRKWIAIIYSLEGVEAVRFWHWFSSINSFIAELEFNILLYINYLHVEVVKQDCDLDELRVEVIKQEHVFNHWRVEVVKQEHVFNRWRVEVVKQERVFNHWHVEVTKYEPDFNEIFVEVICI